VKSVKYLLDTNALGYAFRGQGAVASRMLALAPTDIGIPSPVVYESRAGMLRLPPGERREALLAALDRLLQVVPILPLDTAAAETAARVRAELESRGATIGPIDTLIAGIARSVGAVLVTRNTREFARVEGLLVENWYE
jgi:tRNA(fMet)-specific endonuclease VapC